MRLLSDNSLELTDGAPLDSLTTKNLPLVVVCVFRVPAESKRPPQHMSLALSVPLSPLMALPTPVSPPSSLSLTLSLLLSLPLQLPSSLSLALPLPLYLPISLFLSVSPPSSHPLSLSLP